MCVDHPMPRHHTHTPGRAADGGGDKGGRSAGEPHRAWTPGAGVCRHLNAGEEPVGDIARERVSWLSLASGFLLANLGDQANMHETWTHGWVLQTVQGCRPGRGGEAFRNCRGLDSIASQIPRLCESRVSHVRFWSQGQGVIPGLAPGQIWASEPGQTAQTATTRRLVLHSTVRKKICYDRSPGCFTSSTACVGAVS